ncbi:Hypothetical_protein [Hexamita inflata]|uniref:Hypothetical_protein n=1 Tax=Hexamita inflata TaxID=28002 RepID=A0AA86TTI5_9EUKA|nr:Hypothetical protein HINF_LOCUS15811 [Hexamita inflata]
MSVASPSRDSLKTRIFKLKLLMKLRFLIDHSQHTLLFTRIIKYVVWAVSTPEIDNLLKMMILKRRETPGKTSPLPQNIFNIIAGPLVTLASSVCIRIDETECTELHFQYLFTRRAAFLEPISIRPPNFIIWRQFAISNISLQISRSILQNLAPLVIYYQFVKTTQQPTSLRYNYFSSNCGSLNKSNASSGGHQGISRCHTLQSFVGLSKFLGGVKTAAAVAPLPTTLLT